MKAKNRGTNVSRDFKRKRSRVLFQITAMIIVVFVATGLASFFFFRSSQNRLVEKSVDKLIETQAQDFASTFEVVTDFIVAGFQQSAKWDVQGFITKVKNEVVTIQQQQLNGLMQDMVDKGIVGIDLMLAIIAPGVLSEEAIVMASNDESLIYEWQVPDYILKAFDDGVPYIFMEDGIPELGLTGEQLILFERYSGTGGMFWLLAVRPMGDDVKEIKAFFNEEKNKTNLILALVITASVLIIILITFFVLSYLIRKQITEPVDELSAAAERVMEGDLDVEIAVREGEEFEGLKRVFKEMVDSIRRMIDRSMEG